MALPAERVVMCGSSAYSYEQKAIEFIQKNLPGGEPYRMWGLVDLVDPGGRRYDLDALVLGRHALYLIEIKNYSGRITGDANDWEVEHSNHKKSFYANPSRLANQKARVLASLLRDRMSGRVPWVQHLIFLSSPQADIQRLDAIASLHVCKGDEIVAAVCEGRYRGADPSRIQRPIEPAEARKIQEALKAIGVAPAKARRIVGGFLLTDILEEGPGYQDWLAVGTNVSELRRRVRAYLVPQATSRERREQLARAAEHEARLLTAVGEHGSILHVQGYFPETELGSPCLVFDHWEDVETLGTYIRRHPELPLERRVALIDKIGDALSYCHRKQVVHRGLHPGSVLVRKHPETGELEVRLYNFQLALRHGVTSGTSHLSDFDAEAAEVYRAPEVIEDPRRATPEGDVYSLGALTYFVLTGRHPGRTIKERDELLSAGGGRLRLAAVRDDLAQLGLAASGSDERFRNLDELLAFAMAPSPLERPSSAIEWTGLLVDFMTAPPPHPGRQIDPLEARPKQELEHGLVVDSVLGTGSTARVLRVSRGGSHFALKVALSAEHEARLREEADILRRLKSESVKSEFIVSLLEPLQLGPTQRLCLLLDDAGDTLADLLAREGPQSLDLSQRWGENLLSALEHLEDLGIQHRDIKPSNLGIRAGSSQSKRARRLRLFDFSLSSISADRVTAGTPAYRDPFMPARGAWDEAADRYAAAATLYELLTATRIRWGREDLPATAPDQEAVIEAERFDAAARDRLHEFFRRCFARKVEERFPSAHSMRTAWTACFAEAPRTEGARRPQEGAPAPAPAPGPAADPLAQIQESTLVSSLPLSARALNALDRSGVLTVKDLLALPRNQLSLIRGVGRGTASELLELLRRIESRLSPSREAPRPFFSGVYRGPDLAVSFIPDLSAPAVAALLDAGLGSLYLIAQAPRERVERVLHKKPDAIKALQAAFKARGAPSPTETPRTVQDFLEALVPHVPAKKRGATYLQYARYVLGLEPVKGQILTEVQKVADALGVSRQMVHASLKQAIEKWQEHPGTAALLQVVSSALEAQGGVAPIVRLAEVLPSYLPHRGTPEPAAALAEAAALIRLAGFLARPSDELVMGRVHDRPWLALDRERLELTRRLGENADRLAARDPLPSSDEVLERLREVLGTNPLAALPPDRLVTLAAEASERAAKSARLELYPRRLLAERALTLTAGALTGGPLRAEDIVRAVKSRYPEAEPLPPRPALDVLLEKHQLRWDPATQTYQRAKAAEKTTTYSHLGERLPTTHSQSPLRPSSDPEVQQAREFEQRLKLFVQRRLYRVLLASTKLAEAAAEQLEHSLGVPTLSLDRALLAAMAQVMAEQQVEPQVVYEADRLGPGGPDWGALKQLMAQAAERVLAELRKAQAPQVLIHPGLLARYQLHEFLAGLLELSKRDDAPAILLLVPTFEDKGLPAIVGSAAGTAAPSGDGSVLPIPTTDGAPALTVPEPWVLNYHRGATEPSAPSP